ncbi:nicotinate-nucleotide--dimethylbenzimidazole phosphoribosyltransferase [Aquitalea magnusonii]|uniref:nicotinate-nucleotide--dimethylbenzimidazole phosphoribosyltransferase n=1 Tax=Aquitalea magnusonii TaxID=332411 RepID=UPI0023BB04B9|nr:nicotinate-nucleotide--dimethylbenzimidazole phosphoribosyltransferase [Aquitalea magnusonii]
MASSPAQPPWPPVPSTPPWPPGCWPAIAREETGHRLALQALGLEPLVELGMRLGEGSGAATCVPLLQLAIKLHAEMATFAQAGVTEKD